jgi:hypothetical protein
MVPTFTIRSIGQGGTQLYPGSIATPTPQAFSVASPPPELNGFGVRPRHPARTRALHTVPYPPGLRTASLLRASTTGSLSLHLLASLDEPAPSGSTSTSRLRQGPLATRTGIPRHRLPLSFTRPLRRPDGEGLPPPLDQHGASWRTVPGRNKHSPPSESHSPGAAHGPRVPAR